MGVGVRALLDEPEVQVLPFNFPRKVKSRSSCAAARLRGFSLIGFGFCSCKLQFLPCYTGSCCLGEITSEQTHLPHCTDIILFAN